MSKIFLPPWSLSSCYLIFVLLVDAEILVILNCLQEFCSGILDLWICITSWLLNDVCGGAASWSLFFSVLPELGILWRGFVIQILLMDWAAWNFYIIWDSVAFCPDDRSFCVWSCHGQAVLTNQKPFWEKRTSV